MALGLGLNMTKGSVLSPFEDNYSLLFDNDEDYVTMATQGKDYPDQNEARTISWWAKRTSAENAGLHTEHFFGYGWGATKRRFSVGIKYNTKDVYFYGYNQDADLGYNWDDTDWHHGCLTYDGTNMRLYIDGTDVTGGDGTAVTSGSGGSFATNMDTLLCERTGGSCDLEEDYVANGGFQIGSNQARGSGANNFAGYISDVAIWSGALDAANVAAVYNSGVPFELTEPKGNYTTSANLKGYWKFEEGSGTTATDSSSQGNNGTISDAAYSTTTP